MTLAASIVFIILATYWFAFKEGFFSGLVHLACVIVAGAFAFAFWEPLAHAMLGSASTKEWAWGVSLLAIFCVTLFLLRLAGNFLIPERLNFPAVVDNIGGGVTGLATGVLTAGIGLIGIGFLPIGDVGGGFVRSQNNQAQPAQTSSISFAVLATTSFYETLSRGAFSPLTNRGNLATAYPMLARQAWGLQRDTFRDGRMELATAPSDITVSTPFQGFLPGNEEELVIVPVSVDRGGFNRGTSFVLSASQAHLVGSGSNPTTVFPDAWEAGGRVYLFDDMSHYVTNKSGSQKVSMLLSFPAAKLKGQKPTSLFFKGVRLPLPAATDDFASIRSGGEGPVVEYDRNATSIPNSFLRADRRIGVVLNRNTLASGIKAQKDSITFSPGADIPARSQGSVNKSLRVEFLYELPGTKLVKLDVSRGKSPVDIWEDIRQKAGGKADLVLVDEKGNTFTPIGWLHTQATEGLINVKLDPRSGVDGVEDLPQLSTAGRDDLDVLYTIPIGSRIVAIKLGDETVGVTDVTID